MLARAVAVAIACASLLMAQSRYTISTIAGSLGHGDGGRAIEARLSYISSLATDAAGDIYAADQTANQILKITQQGAISTYVGGNPDGAVNVSGVPAAMAHIYQPIYVTRDRAGNLYFGEQGGAALLRVNSKGILDVIAGNGLPLFPNEPVSENVPATSVRLAGVGPIYADGSGAVLFVESDFFTGGARIRRVSVDGIITTVLDHFNVTERSCFEQSGSLLTVNGSSNQIYRIQMNGTSTLIAGTGLSDFSGDNGPALQAAFNNIYAIAEDEHRNIYVADGLNYRIREITADGNVRTIAGTGHYAQAPAENVPATSAAIGTSVLSITAANGTVYFGEQFGGAGSRVRRISNGVLSTVAGNQGIYDTGPATSIPLFQPGGVAVDSMGEVYFADTYSNCVRKFTPNGLMTTVAGNGYRAQPPPAKGSSGPATQMQIGGPSSVALDAHGNLMIFAYDGVYRLDASRKLTTVVSFSDSYTSGSFPLNVVPQGPGTIDPAGNIYLITNAGVRKLAPDGSLITVTSDQAVDLASDHDGNLYIGEQYRVMKVTPDGKIKRFAGTGVSGTAKENGKAISTEFTYIVGIAADTQGNVYVSDTNGPNKIRLITPDGMIRTIASPGPSTYNVDGGTAAISPFLSPGPLAVDAAGDVYFANFSGADTGSIRRLTPAHRTVDAQIESGPLHPSGSPGSMYASVGTVSAVLNDEQTELILTVTHDVPNATAIRVRRGTPASPGAIVYTFAHTFSPAVAIWTISASDLDAFLAGKLYVEVESSTITDAEIAGQLVPAPRIWITGNTTNVLASIDTVTGATLDIVPAGKDPFGVGFSADGSRVYVAAYSSNELTVFDTGTMTNLGTIATPPAPTLTALLPDGSGLLVTDNQGSEVSIVNFASNSVTSSLAVGANPIGVAVSPDGKRAYVANQGSSSLSIVDLTTGTVAQTVPLAGVPWGVAGSPDGLHAYVSTQAPSVEVVDTVGAKVIASIPLGKEPYPRGIVVSGDGNVAYVAGNYTNEVFVLDLTTNALADTISVASPQGLALSADGSRLYAASLYAAVLTVIDTKSNKVIATPGMVDTANWIAVR